MRKISAIILILALALGMAAPVLATESATVTTPTGYTKAEDVEYITVSGTVVNWGARGEICTFLSTYAQAYYTESYTWDTLSDEKGGTGISDAPASALYEALQNMMRTKHTRQTTYGETRYLYCYTDCLRNDYSHISSFYSGKELSGTWDSGKTWNREHTWPNSKGLGGNDENDIMMLRPTWKSENSSRGNTAYGQSSGYYDPGVNVRGDCARIVLYIYVRWGNVGKMWGSSGVMENLDILLKWMEEDPVDTWEMGRNDAVQSITGTRNVFVDYPEFAWLLFGQEVPENIPTPSGSTIQEPCTHVNTELRNKKAPSCGITGYTGDTFCADCGQLQSLGKSIAATGKHSFGDLVSSGDRTFHSCTVCSFREYVNVENSTSGSVWIVIGIVAAVVVVIGGTVAAVVIIKKKKVQ